MTEIMKISQADNQLSFSAISNEINRLVIRGLSPTTAAISETSAERLVSLNQKHNFLSDQAIEALSEGECSYTGPTIAALRQIEDYTPGSQVWLNQPVSDRRRIFAPGQIAQTTRYMNVGRVGVLLDGIEAAVIPGYVGLMNQAEYMQYQQQHKSRHGNRKSAIVLSFLA